MSSEADDNTAPSDSSLHSGLVPSGRRSAVRLDVRMFDELLKLAVDLRVDSGEDEVAETCVSRLARMLPDIAVGAVLRKIGRAEPRIFPRSMRSKPTLDSSRLFPSFEYESVVVLADGQNSTLHLASREPLSCADESAEKVLVERAGEVLESAILRARSFERAERASLDLRQLQAQFIQAEKLASLGQIVAGIVHELNNPLSSILAYSEYLLNRARQRGDSRGDVERLSRIGEAAERILKYSRELVAYARPASPEPSPVNLCDVIDKALMFCEHEFLESAVEVETRLPRELPNVRGVFNQLTQVFVNLFTNAAHAMARRGGKLRIRATADYESQHVHIEVADEGIGIEPVNLEQIFEPFFTTKPDGRGTGLGLSIVRDIVRAHGGTLEAHSTPRKGSVFSLHLPIFATH